VASSVQLTFNRLGRTGIGNKRKFDTDALTSHRFATEVSNRFEALTYTDLSDDVDGACKKFIAALRTSAEHTIRYRRPSRKPWLSDEAYDV